MQVESIGETPLLPVRIELTVQETKYLSAILGGVGGGIGVRGFSEFRKFVKELRGILKNRGYTVDAIDYEIAQISQEMVLLHPSEVI